MSIVLPYIELRFRSGTSGRCHRPDWARERLSRILSDSDFDWIFWHGPGATGAPMVSTRSTMDGQIVLYVRGEEWIERIGENIGRIAHLASREGYRLRLERCGSMKLEPVAREIALAFGPVIICKVPSRKHPGRRRAGDLVQEFLDHKADPEWTCSSEIMEDIIPGMMARTLAGYDVDGIMDASFLAPDVFRPVEWGRAFAVRKHGALTVGVSWMTVRSAVAMNGPWQIGYLRNQGYGMLRPARRAGMTGKDLRKAA